MRLPVLTPALRWSVVVIRPGHLAYPSVAVSDRSGVPPHPFGHRQLFVITACEAAPARCSVEARVASRSDAFGCTRTG